MTRPTPTRYQRCLTACSISGRARLAIGLREKGLRATANFAAEKPPKGDKLPSSPCDNVPA